MSDEITIHDLPKVASDKGAYIISGKTLKAMFGLIEAVYGGRNISVGGGLTMQGGHDGGVALFGGSGGIGGGTVTLPFQVFTRKNPNDPSGNTYQARVERNSSLLKTLILDDRQEITGLSSDPVAEEDWFNYDRGDDLIWLEVTVESDFSVSAATIASYGLGSNPTWSPGADPGQNDGPFCYTTADDDSGNTLFTQTKARIAIFSSTTDGEGNVVENQLLFSHLRMVSEVYVGDTDHGSATIYIVTPVPHAGPYVSP